MDVMVAGSYVRGRQTGEPPRARRTRFDVDKHPTSSFNHRPTHVKHSTSAAPWLRGRVAIRYESRSPSSTKWEQSRREFESSSSPVSPPSHQQRGVWPIAMRDTLRAQRARGRQEALQDSAEDGGRGAWRPTAQEAAAVSEAPSRCGDGGSTQRRVGKSGAPPPKRAGRVARGRGAHLRAAANPPVRDDAAVWELRTRKLRRRFDLP